MSMSSIGSNERFLKNKYMLVYDNFSSKRNYQYEKEEDRQYAVPRYSIYEIEYARGYNRGDAAFVNIIPGRYILKIKSEKWNKAASYAVNYSSNSNFLMKEVTMSKDEASVLMRQAMVSIIGRSPRATLDQKLHKDDIGFGNHFESIGYGFIAVRSANDNKYDIMV